MTPVRRGVLGAANIAVKKVVPAMQRGAATNVIAIASRDIEKARAAADTLGIPRAYGSYEELLADPDIEAIYNPLPNHLHVPWSIRAAAAGKHVLCEKPIALSAAEARELLAARDRYGVQIGEAFMVRTHPQWHLVRELIAAGRIGELRLVSGHFSYFNRDPANVRNVAGIGGGGLMDIGCYPITVARWLFGTEPTAAVGTFDRDPDFGTDRVASGLLRFPNGQATFSCATQLVPWQRVQIFGTTGRIEVQIPFNAPADRATRVFIDDGSTLGGPGEATEIPAVDQYTLQGDLFSAAVRGLGPVPSSMEDAVANMAVIDALFLSAKTERWESVEQPIL